MVQQRRTTRARSEDRPDENEDQAEPGDDRVLTDNVAKDGVTYPLGTRLGDLPEAVRRHVVLNENLHAKVDEADDGED